MDLKEILQLEIICRDFNWNISQRLSEQIGNRLFLILNGDRQTLLRAIKEADDYGEKLQVILGGENSVSNLPFELVYNNGFLVSSKIHLIRRVSDRCKKKLPEPKNRPLRILLMACSPQDIYPALEFEKEEETIFEVTRDLPVEIDVEDSGSLEGLGEWLAINKYDIVHITGHADIDKNGEPFFLMEDSEGFPIQVTPLQLWNVLNLNMPRLIFLSGCRTGQAPEHAAAVSFANRLVTDYVPSVLGWGLPVSDLGASFAAKNLYFELSRGENILDALLRTRYELFKSYPDWSLLRLFSDGTPLEVPLVERGQVARPRQTELQYTYLVSSQVKVLRKGFLGRRRQIQQGLRCLKKDREKVGLLLHGTGGLGKSCLAGKYCDRFKDHVLIIIHGDLNAYTFHEALKDAFYRGNDNEGLKILDIQEEMPDKIRRLCSSIFQRKQYLILLDDFEKNLAGIKDGKTPQVCTESVPILESLLRFLPYSGKTTQLIITTRYTFSLTVGGKDMVRENLEFIGLTSFRDADEKKKVSELNNIINYSDPEIRKRLIEAGRGNPRLMESLNVLIGEINGLDIVSLLSRVKDEQDEFVQGLVLNEVLKAQPVDFRTFLSFCAVYRLPVLKEGFALLFSDLKDWQSQVEKAVRLSLMEMDSSHIAVRYWVTPLLREDMFEKLEDEEKIKCHQSAVSYYQEFLSKSYEPVSSAHLIEHALSAGLFEIALEESGSRFLPYLRKSLAYTEALKYGNYILLQIPDKIRDTNFGKFMFELGCIYYDMGNNRQAIQYSEQALSIFKEVYGERHPAVVATLNNIGVAWGKLGKSEKALQCYEQALLIVKELYGEGHLAMATTFNNIGTSEFNLGKYERAKECYEQALTICKELYGDRNPVVAASLNNIGRAWDKLGKSEKAIQYYEQSLLIVKELYGEKHPEVARSLNSIGLACCHLGEFEKAIQYHEQAFSIYEEVYGERHPEVAECLNNIGTAWENLGEIEKSIKYLVQALSIDKEVYGERHPAVAVCLNNIGHLFYNLGESEKAIEYHEQAFSIFKEVYGKKHPDVASSLNNIGLALYDLGDTRKGIDYIKQAYNMLREFYGDEHPDTKFFKKSLDSLR
nr:MAG: tetratricopeptide repeat protein [Candidatus Methanoperedens sp.]